MFVDKTIRDWVQRLIVEGTGIFYLCWEKVVKQIKKYNYKKDIKNYEIEQQEDGKNKLKVQKNEKTIYEGIKIYTCPLNKFLYPAGITNIQDAEWCAIQLQPLRWVKYRGKS